jgi:2-amino-4-hydroxy-6-hydroxymethyldihydropteridine diphosphokinase
MILIGLGANLPSAAGPPSTTLTAALAALEESGVKVLARSRFYRSAPVPPSDQPWFVNAVAAVAIPLDPAALLALLHDIETRFGRARRAPNAARTLDLDLLDYDGLLSDGGEGSVLPHPRLHQRAFVLLPLAEVAPLWRHPRLGRSVADLIAALLPEQQAEPIEG